jgi:2-iminobutanoate/2-iminopropanoate deaminase
MRRVVTTVGAPKAIGPYSQAVVFGGGLVFCSGQVALDPATGELVGASDVKAQTRRVMENLKAVLEAAGSSLDRVAKTTIFLADMGDFAAVNEVYGSYFTVEPPARSTVQVAALPRGALVEIEAIAVAATSATSAAGATSPS